VVATFTTRLHINNSDFLFIRFVWFSHWTAIISLNSVNQLIFVTVKYGVSFAVRTDLLNIILTSFGFKGLTSGNHEARQTALWKCNKN
jgi:hypothetical protein